MIEMYAVCQEMGVGPAERGDARAEGVGYTDDLIDIGDELTLHCVHDGLIAAGPLGKVVDAVVDPVGGEFGEQVGGDRERGEDNAFDGRRGCFGGVGVGGLRGGLRGVYAERFPVASDGGDEAGFVDAALPICAEAGVHERGDDGGLRERRVIGVI